MLIWDSETTDMGHNNPGTSSEHTNNDWNTVLLCRKQTLDPTKQTKTTKSSSLKNLFSTSDAENVNSFIETWGPKSQSS